MKDIKEASRDSIAMMGSVKSNSNRVPKIGPLWEGGVKNGTPFSKQHLIKVSKRFNLPGWARNQARQVKLHGGNMNETLVEEIFLVQNSHRRTYPQIHIAAIISIWRISKKVRFSKPRNTLMAPTGCMTRILYKSQTWRRLGMNKHCVGPQ